MEREWFSKHPKYGKIAHKMGIPHLRTVLNSILINHIKQCVPTLSKQIAIEKASTEKERKKYGEEGLDPTKFAQCQISIAGWVNEFVDEYRELIEGKKNVT